MALPSKKILEVVTRWYLPLQSSKSLLIIKFGGQLCSQNDLGLVDSIESNIQSSRGHFGASKLALKGKLALTLSRNNW